MNLKAKYPQEVPGMLVSSRCPPQAHSKPPSSKSTSPWATTYILTFESCLPLWSSQAHGLLYTLLRGFSLSFQKGVTFHRDTEKPRGGACITTLEAWLFWRVKIDRRWFGIMRGRWTVQSDQPVWISVLPLTRRGGWFMRVSGRPKETPQGWLLTLQHLQALKPVVCYTLS